MPTQGAHRHFLATCVCALVLRSAGPTPGAVRTTHTPEFRQVLGGPTDCHGGADEGASEACARKARARGEARRPSGSAWALQAMRARARRRRFPRCRHRGRMALGAAVRARAACGRAWPTRARHAEMARGHRPDTRLACLERESGRKRGES